jgi:tetratricopeptide (TPR) repeat protein
MTSNHLLLYRLAELMLEHEQHILPVDLLFDDEQIGDLVKSIQIDSPYQQMLFEGVLTESVREEKLYVSFTVEGYFHYVLGEVIYNKTQGKGAEALKKIVDNNKLNGAKEGVEQCLIRDVKNGLSQRVIELIDLGGESLNACVFPLAQLFLIAAPKNNIPFNEDKINEHITLKLQDLFSEASHNDLDVLQKTIELLIKNQRTGICIIIHKALVNYLEPHTILHATLLAKAAKHLEKRDVMPLLAKLEKSDLYNASLEYTTYLNSMAELYNYISDHKKAIENHQNSLRIHIQLFGQIHSNIGVNYNGLGYEWSKLGNFNKALEYYKKSLSIRLKLYSNSHAEISQSYNNLGFIWRQKGDLNLAIEFYEKSLSDRFKINGAQHPSTAISLNNLGMVWRDKGELNKALEFNENALSIFLNVYGEEHYSSATCLTSIGIVWGEIGNDDKALEYYNRALLTFIKINGEDHSSVASIYNNIGYVWVKKGKYDKAVSYYEKSLDIRINACGDSHIDTGQSYNNLGHVWSKIGDFDLAIMYYKKSIDITINVHDNKFHSLGFTYNSIGDLYNKKVDEKRARIYYEKARRIFYYSNGVNHPHTKLLEEKINKLNDL